MADSQNLQQDNKPSDVNSENDPFLYQKLRDKFIYDLKQFNNMKG